MHYKIAICDDEAADRALLDTLVRRWAAAAGHTVQLEAFESAEQFLFHYAEENDYDVLLLDVEMGQMDGVALAREIRKQNEAVQIVLKLFSVLDRAAQKVAKNERVLHLLTGGEMVQVPVHKIRYAEVMGNYVTLHAGEEVTVKMTLSELESQLDDRFYRAGRSLVVNLTQISRVTKTDIRLLDGTAIHLPRGAYEGINRAIIAMN